MSVLHRLAAHAGRPLLMTPDAALTLAQRAMTVDPRLFKRETSSFVARPLAFMSRLGLVKADWSDGAVVTDEEPLQPKGYAPSYAGEPEAEGYGWSLVDGIACMDIEGALLDRGFCSISGAMFWGYDTIAQSMREAMAEPRVRAMFIRVQSPGGVVAGGLEALTADIRSMRETGNASGKPIWVYADCAASAAYWISAQADRIIAPAVGMVGSIGAVIVHEDWSGAYEKHGVAVTSVQFGAKKTDGAHFKPLSEEARADLQASIDEVGARFVADVVAGREFLSEKALIATEAAVFTADHSDPARSGRALGLVDAIQTEEAAFAALKQHISGVLPAPSAPKRAPAPGNAAVTGAKSETDDMSKKTNARLRAALDRKAATDEEKLQSIRNILDDEEGTEAEGEEDEVEAEDEDETTAETEEESTEGDTEEEAPAEDEEEKPAAKGKKATVDLKVAQAILDLPQAKGREKLAASLALKGMSVADARDVLASAPKTSRLIGNVHDPKLGAAGETVTAAKTDDEKASAFILASAEAARGAPRKRA